MAVNVDAPLAAQPLICTAQEGSGASNDTPIPGRVVRRDPNHSGHDCEFVHPPPNVQTVCSICLLVLRTPHLVTCCGHNFCKECIERVQKAGKCCPLCNAENFFQAYNRSHDQSLRQFEVYCTHREDGCEWTGKLEMLDGHLNVNPRIDKMMEGCAYAEVQCFNNGCEQFYQRRVILDQHCRACPLRDFSCEHCHEYESTYYGVTTNHWPVCKCYPLICPHECRQDTIQRQYLEQHLNEECPLQELDCEFKYAGCETRLPRKDMPDHLRDGIIHMTLLARQNQLLSQQNQELMTKMLEKEEQFRRTREEDRREMEEKLTKHQQRLAEKDEQIAKLTDSAARISEEVGDLTRKLKATEGSLAEVRTLKTQVDDLSKKHVSVSTTVERLHHHVAIAPLQIIMPNFKHYKDTSESWYSDGFYTHPQGYKVCLCVDANGVGVGEDTHVSYFIYLMRGEFDSRLNWPLRGVFTITLLNQRGDANHHTDTIAFDDMTNVKCAARLTGRKRSALGWGKYQFLPHGNLNYNRTTNCQYLMNGCLHFQVKFRMF